MSALTEIVFILVLIVVGLNLSANNMIISLLHNYIFFKDKLSAKLLRISGIIMMLSSLLVIIGYTNYCIYVNLFLILMLTFFSIRGRNKAFKEKLNAREQLLKAYQEEIKQKRERLEQLKHSVASSVSTDQNDPKSVEEIKKRMWDDGTMTSKDLIEGFKKNS